MGGWFGGSGMNGGIVIFVEFARERVASRIRSKERMMRYANDEVQGEHSKDGRIGDMRQVEDLRYVVSDLMKGSK